jgi:FKBP-type peptidyl-prolyl cis-trans isomerase FkpA
VPLEFHLDRGEVLPGLDDGVFGMRVGERRLLRIPPELAYGDAGVAGQVPPGATLVLEVELVDLQQ